MQRPTSCTLFSVTAAEMAASGLTETSLPAYDSAIKSRITAQSAQHILKLGELWIGLHEAWGEPPPEHPLGFFVGGGVPENALDMGEQSSGRYFDTDAVARIVDALDAAEARVTPGIARRVFTGARAANPATQEAFRRLVAFVRETRDANRGMIVHQFR